MLIKSLIRHTKEVNRQSKMKNVCIKCVKKMSLNIEILMLFAEHTIAWIRPFAFPCLSMCLLSSCNNCRNSEQILRKPYIYVNIQQDALYRLIYYSKSSLHVSVDVFAHCQEQLTAFTVSGSVHPRCCRLVSWMSWNWTMWIVRRVNTPHNPHSSVSTHPRHQPAANWMNTTRYCKYSQVFLMMDESIARNM
jgi:hypothetical protein